MLEQKSPSPKRKHTTDSFNLDIFSKKGAHQRHSKGVATNVLKTSRTIRPKRKKTRLSRQGGDPASKKKKKKKNSTKAAISAKKGRHRQV